MARPHSEPAWEPDKGPAGSALGTLGTKREVFLTAARKCVWDERYPPAMRTAVEAYLKRHSKKKPVSIARVVRATRAAIPDLSVSDEELADIIAEEAIDKGCSVDFESRDSGPEFHILR